jgi:hypothetical protein
MLLKSSNFEKFLWGLWDYTFYGGAGGWPGGQFNLMNPSHSALRLAPEETPLCINEVVKPSRRAPRANTSHLALPAMGKRRITIGINALPSINYKKSRYSET